MLPIFCISDSPPIFCFLSEVWLEEGLCSPVAIPTCAVGTEMTAGVPWFARTTVDVTFLMIFFEPSKGAGRTPSSYSFLFTVPFV